MNVKGRNISSLQLYWAPKWDPISSYVLRTGLIQLTCRDQRVRIAPKYLKGYKLGFSATLKKKA